uniref:Autophagy-related protein 27 n=1 Tax=Caenorhabditis tropicalis TaxID=1561998 RepID=A0A1I7TL81_9PELO
MNLKFGLLLSVTIVSIVLFIGHIVSEYFDIFSTPSNSFSASNINEPLTPQEIPGLSGSSSRTCNQCVSGNFLSKRWLMQDDRVAQRMGWIDAWTGTDCLKGNVNYYHNCQTTCLTIEIQNIIDVPKSIYEGIMMDCADDLIYNSPDIPREGYKHEPISMVFEKNETFVNDRLRHRITYKFTTASSKDPKQLAIKFQRIYSGLSNQKPTTGTNYIYTIIYGIFVGLLVMATCAVWWFYNRRESNGNRNTTLSRWRMFDRVKNYRKNAVQLNFHQLLATYHVAPLVRHENDPIYDVPPALETNNYDVVQSPVLQPQNEVVYDIPYEPATSLNHTYHMPGETSEPEWDESSIETTQEDLIGKQINDQGENKTKEQASDTNNQPVDATKNNDESETPILTNKNESV